VVILKQSTAVGPSAEEESFMRRACCVMDANAFETARIPKEVANTKPVVSTELDRPLNGATPSLRGLYPLAAMMNHACTPNTLHGYDGQQRMAVRAATSIPAGTELTNSYTSLLWGTTARRHHLAITKHFSCSCSRCSDPQVRPVPELSSDWRQSSASLTRRFLIPVNRRVVHAWPPSNV
jgi:hypothetical protein